ncbi:MAG: FecR domain-containing protein [Pseudomonadota bacterium]
MSEKRREQLMREAAEIFFELRNDPDNSELQARRDEFLVRGKAERETYDHLLKTWKASGVMRAPKRLRSVLLFLCGLTGATALAYDPVRIAVLSDLSTSGTPEQSTLASGDVAFLDADTALVDDTDGQARAVELLDGAAFFAVESDPRPFTVEVGDVRVRVVGTEFETAFVEDTVLIGVAEGQVNISLRDQSWQLTAGEQFTWSDDFGAVIDERDITLMASWREDRLIVDGLSFGQAADIIERRLSGRVVFTNATLRNTPVAGIVDLSDPLVALRILAELSGARVYHAPGIGRVITPR